MTARRITAPMATSAALMFASVVLRTGVFDGVGEYSDIVHLFRRDGLAGHPVPYFDYTLEYPVLIGAFVWVVGFVHWGAGLYFAASAALLGALAVATVWLLERLRSANPWLLAAAPAVVFWGVQNWDFLAICPLVGALVLFERRRDGWGAVALAVSVSVKFFPLVVLPIVLAVRMAERRVREACLIAGAFAAVTVAVNAPVAIDRVAGGLSLRPAWTFFFRFSRDRFPENTLWTGADTTVSQINLLSGLLLGAGLVGAVAVAVLAVRRGQAALVPVAAIALLWFFATTKVYSAQYALWIMLALALAAAPVGAAVAFVAIDVAFFVTLWGGLSWLGDSPTDVRQLATAALAGLVALRLVRPPPQPRG